MLNCTWGDTSRLTASPPDASAAIGIEASAISLDANVDAVLAFYLPLADATHQLATLAYDARAQ